MLTGSTGIKEIRYPRYLESVPLLVRLPLPEEREESERLGERASQPGQLFLCKMTALGEEAKRKAGNFVRIHTQGVSKFPVRC